jgi:hypothetical protein
MTRSASLYRRILGEIAANDPDDYAPPLITGLLVSAFLFPWRTTCCLLAWLAANEVDHVKNR